MPLADRIAQLGRDLDADADTARRKAAALPEGDSLRVHLLWRADALADAADRIADAIAASDGDVIQLQEVS